MNIAIPFSTVTNKQMTTKPEPPANPRWYYVYFIQRDDDLIKIGSTISVDNTIKKLQAGSNDKFVVLGVIPGGGGLVSEIKARFSYLLQRGGWYKPVIELRKFIDGAKKTYDAKDKDAHESACQVEQIKFEDWKKALEESSGNITQAGRDMGRSKTHAMRLTAQYGLNDYAYQLRKDKGAAWCGRPIGR